LNIRKLNLFKLIIDKFKEYANNFNNELNEEVDNKINELSLNWDQKKNINLKYQKMFDILFSNKELTQLKYDEIDITKQKINNTNNIDFICVD
jgi:hypothetical protein